MRNPIAILFLVQVTISLSHLCPKQNLCKCKYYGREVNLYCVGTEDLIDLRRCLTDNFYNFTIRTVYVKECNATSVPARFVQNLTLKYLYMKCPLVNFSEDAFVGSYERVLQFRLYNHRLTAIPNAFSSTPNLQRLWITNGSLENIQDELKYLKDLGILSLRRNRIEYVSPDAFTFTKNLHQIFLSDNRIKYIDPTTFASCRIIKTFFVTNNQLETVKGLLDAMNPAQIYLNNNNLTDIHIFHPKMFRTIKMDLSSNPVGNIDSSVFARDFQILDRLSLSNMSLTHITEDAFSFLPALTFLDLSMNRIEFIYKGTFKNLTNLETLDLSQNKISSIKGIIFSQHVAMRTLLMSNNRINNLEDTLRGMQTIGKLIFDKNEIQALSRENFPKNSHVSYFSARSNKISIITKDCFQNFFKITKLDLARNLIVSLNGSIQNLFTLEQLVLPFNSIEKLDDDDLSNLPLLKKIDFMANRLSSLNKQFRYLLNLRYLNLRENRILTLSRNLFPNVIPITQLLLKGNPLVCDCRLEWLRKWSKMLKDDPICQAPHWLNGRHFKNLSINDLIEWKESCPSPCKCSCISNGFDFGINVDCSRRNLIEMPEVVPSKMIRFDVSYNNLSYFHIPLVNLSWFNLQELNVENNQIASVKNLHSPKSLSILKMANNKIERLAAEDMVNYSLVTASGNPWLCDCSTLHFRTWLFTVKNEIMDVNQTMCAKGNVKKELRHIPIIYLSEPQICPPKVALYILISIGVLGFLVIISTAGVTYFRFGLSIKIWLYSHGFTCVKEDEIDKDKIFDAFLSYSNYDEEFVHSVLRPPLENETPEFFLCIHERNFPPGYDIYESIFQAVRWSRRTVLVLSKNFLESDWCILEFRTAHLQALKDKINRVIVIVYGELPPTEDIDKELKAYLDNVTYLEWGDKYFWQKLRYALPKVKNDRERESLHFDETTHLLIGY